MSNLTEQQPFLPQTRVANSTCVSLRLTAIITGLLSIMSLLTGCGDGGEPGPRQTGSTDGAAVAGADDDRVVAGFQSVQRSGQARSGHGQALECVRRQTPHARNHGSLARTTIGHGYGITSVAQLDALPGRSNAF